MSALNTSVVNDVTPASAAAALASPAATRNPPPHKPVHPYTGRKGSPPAAAAAASAPVKASVKPVGPRSTDGWPLAAAYTTPAAAAERRVSATPSTPPVATDVSAPNATAGASAVK